MDRRDFLKLASVSIGGGVIAGGARPVRAGEPQPPNLYLELIPRDKRLDPGWLRSLTERGNKDLYSDPAALRRIGMPVGGLFAGTVYLSGDGQLWLWDIFNRDQEGIGPERTQPRPGSGDPLPTRDGLNYLWPCPLVKPFAQGFVARLQGRDVPLDQSGFRTVTFRGEYPRARITYADPDLPVSATLEAFSPFIPLQADESSLPATLMRYTLTNVGATPLEVEVAGYLENPVCLYSGERHAGARHNRVVREPGLVAVECSASSQPQPALDRPDILFEDFEQDTYDGWTVEGTAFGDGPIRQADVPDYQGDLGGDGRRVVNSHASAPGANVNEKDAHTGALTSRRFPIVRRYITFRLGGGSHAGRTGVELLVDGEVVASVSGSDDNRMRAASLDAQRFEGQPAQLRIVDRESGGWGNVGIDEIRFSDRPAHDTPVEQEADFGTMVLGLLSASDEQIAARASRDQPGPADEANAALPGTVVGKVGRTVRLAPGEQAEWVFLIAWHFPNFSARGAGGQRVGHAYAARFADALAVARYLAANEARLTADTRAWVDTWYDSTLPYWLLDRTMANTSTLATTTCYRFQDGRFWAWEGIGCCAGTCTHVWHYAQAPGRLFPEIERDTRERVDFGIGFHPDGGIGMRAGLHGANEPAHDGQCGRILGAYREHQMSADGAFLQRTWPRIRQAIEYLIAQDGNDDGMIEGAQPNTLDASWFGRIPFLASLYLAALRAGQAMATELGDQDFAERCRTIADRGAETILELFDGEYFVQQEDPAHAGEIGTGPGCYIDQVFGQSWAHQVGLGRLFDADKQRSALRALWTYNFLPRVGPFRERFTRGRWYAAANDAGLLMCTWPKGGQNPDFRNHWQYMYFNECMSGFEWQVAAHMVWEGDDPALLQSGLAVSRAIHDRYRADQRNPYNEVECSDHYARAMASYGVFLAATGFACHGPKRHLAFSPRLHPEQFRAAFTAATGWGTLTQEQTPQQQTNQVIVRFGELRLRTLTVTLPENASLSSCEVRIADTLCPATCQTTGREVLVTLTDEVPLQRDAPLVLTLQFQPA